MILKNCLKLVTNAILLFSLGIINLHGQENNPKSVFIEGFYEQAFELSAFYEIKDSNVCKACWLSFSDSLKMPDSLGNILKSVAENKSVYIKAEGIIKMGGNYGHLGASNKEIEVYRLLQIDTCLTLGDYLKQKHEN